VQSNGLGSLKEGVGISEQPRVAVKMNETMGRGLSANVPEQPHDTVKMDKTMGVPKATSTAVASMSKSVQRCCDNGYLKRQAWRLALM
jgi:hypothetical protein